MFLPANAIAFEKLLATLVPGNPLLIAPKQKRYNFKKGTTQ